MFVLNGCVYMLFLSPRMAIQQKRMEQVAQAKGQNSPQCSSMFLRVYVGFPCLAGCMPMVLDVYCCSSPGCTWGLN